MNFRKILLGVALSVAAATAANAAVIETVRGGHNITNISYFSPLGQSFIVSENGLNSVSLSFNVMNPSQGAADVTLRILDGWGVGANVISQRTFMPEVAPYNNVNPAFTNVDFTGTLLNIGQRYYFEVSTPNRYWGLVTVQGSYIDGSFFPTISSYADGEMLSGQSAFANNDIRFRIETSMVNLPGAVPEPASWAMLIAGFGLVGSALRRRKSAVAA